jgi:drug/metabolite transporter (DMT)-like permease
MMAFGLYSFTVRNFPISIASPINTIAVMIIVFILAALLFGEVITAQKVLGIVFGLIAIILLLPA